MPECRGCGVALDWHEHELCAECWEAREVEDDGFAVVIFDSGEATDG